MTEGHTSFTRIGSVSALQDWLDEQGVVWVALPDRPGVELATRLGASETEVVVGLHWLPGLGLLRVIAEIVEDVPRDRLGAVAARIAAINARLPLLGFVVWPSRARVAHVSCARLDAAGGLPVENVTDVLMGALDATGAHIEELVTEIHGDRPQAAPLWADPDWLAEI